MFLHVALVVAAVYSSEALPRPEPPQMSSRTIEPKQVLYVPERQQYTPELQYDVALLDPQFQIPSYNFIGDKQHFPRVQPQIVLYHGGAAPGQPFLLQPGSPPGNFLVPQGGPNVIIRDTPHAPPRPVFVAGYPKPAHIPPIEKDAEEVPTNPAKIPPFQSKGEKRPEKIETFNEDDNTKKQATEADVLAAADRNPAFNPTTNLRPGQRFFILNGQPLFSNFPYNNQIYPGVQSNVNLKYAQTGSSFAPQISTKTISPYQNLVFRNRPIEAISARHALSDETSLPQGNPLPANLEQSKEDKAQFRQAVNSEIGNRFGILEYADNDQQDDDSVVIDAGDHLSDEEGDSAEGDAEVVSAADKLSEPTIAQAQPGAIALAGPGGVAAAAPRGTAFVGKDGVAVSSPQATAVAGPSRDEIVEEEKKKKQSKRKP
ncbi:uncharacterized protein LOC135122691 isoform X2 [Zophobas morio]|uniref:uncharacterized protein LOC135122691 isoform X2 n=1 Tax=Zophobas morio TaxID=2755281 RepID=UPI003082C17B